MTLYRQAPTPVGITELRRAFAALMAEVGRRGELILDETTPAQRRALVAIALRENGEFARDAFFRFTGFRGHSSLASAMRPFLRGKSAVLEKRARRFRYRERFMRLWMLLQVIRNPSVFLPSRSVLVADHPPAGSMDASDSNQILESSY